MGATSILGEVQESLRNERFVTLLGPGGIGKTTIAVAAGHALAEEFGGEVYFVDLGSLADPDLVVRAIGTSLGLALKSNEASLELVDLIRSRKLLIILDNCEHVIQAAASIAEQLFQEAGQIHLLATSRELLKVEGEHCYRVDPLDFPPAESEQTADAVLGILLCSSLLSAWPPEVAISFSPTMRRHLSPTCAEGWMECRSRSNWPPARWLRWA